MLNIRIFLLVILFNHLLSPITAVPQRNIHCHKEHWLFEHGFYEVTNVTPPRLSDCHAAINMIPSGAYHLDGQHLSQPLHFYRPPQYRDRTFLIPAIFRSGTCIVAVFAYPSIHELHTGRAHAPKKAATAMYNVIWPHVRSNATQITQRCLTPVPKAGAKGGDQTVTHDLKGGAMRTSISLGKASFPYAVDVRGLPKGMPGDGWKVQLHPEERDAISFNVYEAGGEMSGQGRKGLWKARIDE